MGSGDDQFAFDPVLQYEATSLVNYEEKIFDLSNQSWSLCKVIQAYRWLNYLNHEIAICIGDIYDPNQARSNPFVKMYLRYFKALRRKVYSSFSLTPPVDRVSVKVPAEVNKLTHTIVSNADSHIGFFPLRVGCPKSERELIKADLLARASAISAPTDPEFEARIRSCINSAH